jgi:hypothetical protein
MANLPAPKNHPPISQETAGFWVTMNTETNIILNPEILTGRIVLAIGFTMLAKINGGQKYRIEYQEQRYGGAIFTFYRPKGKREIVSHRAASVASSIKSHMDGTCQNGLMLA